MSTPLASPLIEIKVVYDEALGGIERLNAAVDRLAGAVDKLSSTLGGTVQAMNSIGQAATQASQSTQQISQAATPVVKSMQRVTNAAGQVTQTVTKMSDGTTAIQNLDATTGQITKTIRTFKDATGATVREVQAFGDSTRKGDSNIVRTSMHMRWAARDIGRVGMLLGIAGAAANAFIFQIGKTGPQTARAFEMVTVSWEHIALVLDRYTGPAIENLAKILEGLVPVLEFGGGAIGQLVAAAVLFVAVAGPLAAGVIQLFSAMLLWKSGIKTLNLTLKDLINYLLGVTSAEQRAALASNQKTASLVEQSAASSKETLTLSRLATKLGIVLGAIGLVVGAYAAYQKATELATDDEKSYIEKTVEFAPYVIGIAADLAFLIFVIGKAGLSFASFGATTGKLGGAIGSATGAIAGMSAATATLAAILGAVVAIVFFVAALGEAFETVRKGGKDMLPELKGIYQWAEGLPYFLGDVVRGFIVLADIIESFRRAMVELAKGLLGFEMNIGAIKRGLGPLYDLFVGLGEAINNFLGSLGMMIRGGILTLNAKMPKPISSLLLRISSSIEGFWKDSVAWLMGIWEKITAPVAATTAVFDTAGIQAAFVGAITGFITFLVSGFQGFLGFIWGGFRGFLGWLTGLPEAIKGGWAGLWTWLQSGWQGFLSWLQGGYKGLLDFFTRGWEGMIGSLKSIWDSFVTWLKGIFEPLKTLGIHIPGLQRGGRITAAGVAYLHPPEVVVPGGMGMGNINISNYITVQTQPGQYIDYDLLARKITEKQRENLGRFSGGLGVV